MINGKKIFNNINEIKFTKNLSFKKNLNLKKYPSLSIETILISLNKKVKNFDFFAFLDPIYLHSYLEKYNLQYIYTIS